MAFPTATVTQGTGLTVNTLPNAGQATMTNSLPVVVASDQSTIPVSNASLPLPTGAATSAKQPALGTAGTASTDVITVQGIASGTAQAVSVASLPLPTGAATLAKQPALGTAGTASTDVITVQGIAGATAQSVTAAQTGTWTVQPGNTANTTAWKVDGSAVTQPTSSSQAGTWTVQPGNTANTTAWKVDGSAVTQPVSNATLPLPTGASTNAGSSNFATAQVSVTTGNTTIATLRAGRFAITVINTGTNQVFLGVTGVSITTGVVLPGVVGASVTIPTSAAVFGTVASGTQTVCVLETF
jgi:hypothetical protein